MANFDLQGEIDTLSEKQTKFVCGVFEKLGFEGSKILIETLGKAGDNYASNVKTITAESKDGKTFKMIAKIAPTSDYLRMAMDVETVFGNEFAMYSKVLPTFRQLEIAEDTPEENRIKFPICYGIFDETMHEIILLEDLRESDYVMRDRFKSLTDEEIRVILDSFAKLHSLSFVLKKKDPDTYEKYTTKLTEFFSTPTMEQNVKNGFHIVEANVLSLFDTDRYAGKIRGALTNLSVEAKKLRRCDAGSKYSVIVHGDSWTNNVMLKVNNETDIPEESMLIDYQLSCERSPVSDFLYLTLNCTDRETRSKHYNDWIDAYHEQLDKYLSHYGIKANYVFSKEKMLADLQRYSKFFLGWSIMIANVLCMDTEGAARLKDAMKNAENAEEMIENYGPELNDSGTQNLLKTKVQGLIDSYYDFGYC